MKKLLILLLLTSCGQDSSSSGERSQPKPIDQTLADAQGQPGAKGEKGDTGPAGRDGKDGQDAKPIASNQWLDAISGKFWLIGGQATYVETTVACSNGWKLPSRDELAAALLRGLDARLPTFTKPYWTSTESPGGKTVLNSVGFQEGYPLIDASNGQPIAIKVLCVQL